MPRELDPLPFLLVAVPLFCVAAYGFSSGPALRITVELGASADYWNLAYRPLTLARDVVPGFNELFQQYLDLWTR